MRKQPKARQAKSKSREAAFYELVKKTEKKQVGRGVGPRQQQRWQTDRRVRGGFLGDRWCGVGGCCVEQDVKKLSLESAQARLGNFVLAFNDANLR